MLGKTHYSTGLAVASLCTLVYAGTYRVINRTTDIGDGVNDKWYYDSHQFSFTLDGMGTQITIPSIPDLLVMFIMIGALTWLLFSKSSRVTRPSRTRRSFLASGIQSLVTTIVGALAISRLILLGLFFFVLYITGSVSWISDSPITFENGVVLGLLMTAFLLGTLFPDIDSEQSTLGRYVPFIAHIIPHRTVTHTLWFVLLFAGLTWFTGSAYVFMFTLGIVFHIVEDTFSKQSIAWLFPFTTYDTFGNGGAIKRGWKVPHRYSVGGSFETSVFHISNVITALSCVALVVISAL